MTSGTASRPRPAHLESGTSNLSWQDGQHQFQEEQALDESEMEFAADELHRLNFVERPDDFNAESPNSMISPTSTNLGSIPYVNDKEKDQSKFKTALEDIRHFAGGLISHPYESTKHYSILRHSHGLVYYSGSYTSLAITIFADQELPSDRSLWLQRKGWSGNTGLKAGVIFGTKGAWINVTPSVNVTPEELKSTDERAWQRDIKKFLDKAPKNLRNHQVRETNILRIPCHADDGYLRVVLCTGEKGKKFLCPSPLFRLASTSTDSSSVRGSSLKTMPLEASVKVASIVAKSAAIAGLTPVAATAGSYASSQLSQVYQPDTLTKTAAKAAYNASGVKDRITNDNGKYDTSKGPAQTGMKPETFDALTRPAVIGEESGPSQPYPIRFDGEVVQGIGESTSQFGLPSATLNGVPEDILLKNEGVFFGWVAVRLPKKLKSNPETSNISEEWHESVIYITSDSRTRAKVVQKKVVRVYIIHEFGKGVQFFSAKLSVIMMGYVRPILVSRSTDHDIQSPSETSSVDFSEDTSSRLFDLYKDIAVTTASLARDAWSVDSTLDLIKTRSSNRSFTEKCTDLRKTGQSKLDQMLPVHKVGIRTNHHGSKDRLIGNGGVCVPR